jgi:hypothetical protein
MEGTAKRQVNAEEMLAELKRALESSTHAPSVPPPSASTAAESSSPGRETWQSQIDRESDRPVKANADRSIGQPADLQKSIRPSSRRWTLTTGGLALAVAATIGVSFALMNKAPDLPEREPSVAATEGLVRPQNEQTLKPSSDSRSPMEDSRQSAPLNTRPEVSIAPANNGSVPAQGKAEVDAPHFASTGLETAAPAYTPAPLSSAAVLVPSQRIGPDGAPITKAPSPPVPTVSAPPLAETPKPPAPSAGPQMLKWDAAPIATARSTPASTDSAHPAETPNRAAAAVAPQMVKPDAAPIATAPSTPASTASALLTETPNQAATPAASQSLKSDGAPIATAPSTPASTDSAPLTATPRPKAMPIAHASNESKQASTPKIDSKKKSLEKASLQKPLGSPKPPVKPIAQAERQSTAPAPLKEAVSSPQTAQGAGNPTAAAPVTAPTVQQRFADGMTHAFGYLMHLPGALVPHFGGSNPDAH